MQSGATHTQRACNLVHIHNRYSTGLRGPRTYAVDFPDDVVLMGHDGPGHIRIDSGKNGPSQRRNTKAGSGLSLEGYTLAVVSEERIDTSFQARISTSLKPSRRTG